MTDRRRDRLPARVSAADGLTLLYYIGLAPARSSSRLRRRRDRTNGSRPRRALRPSPYPFLLLLLLIIIGMRIYRRKNWQNMLVIMHKKKKRKYARKIKNVCIYNNIIL